MTQSWHERLLAGGGGIPGAGLRGILGVAARAYGLIIQTRNCAYTRGWLPTRRVAAPVISVGNLTTGGTGKTPLVIELVKRLAALGRCPAVVSRGYKARRAGPADELLLIERSCPGVVVVADADRVAAARRAMDQYGADVIVVDDGFQHRRLGRDLDLVVVDATRPFGLGYMLPRGYLREPIENVRRADAVVLTRTDQVTPEALGDLQERIDRLANGRPQLPAVHRPIAVRELGGPDGHADPVVLRGRAVYLLAGIGHQQSFAETVRSLGARVCGEHRFPDHHAYRCADVDAVCREAGTCGADWVLTTEKDAVKLDTLGRDWALPIRVLAVRIDFLGAGGKMLDMLLGRCLSAVPAGAGPVAEAS